MLFYFHVMNSIFGHCFCRDLSYNQLSGTFPSWVREQDLQLYVRRSIKCYLIFHFSSCKSVFGCKGFLVLMHGYPFSYVLRVLQKLETAPCWILLFCLSISNPYHHWIYSIYLEWENSVGCYEFSHLQRDKCSLE